MEIGEDGEFMPPANFSRMPSVTIHLVTFGQSVRLDPVSTRTSCFDFLQRALTTDFSAAFLSQCLILGVDELVVAESQHLVLASTPAHLPPKRFHRCGRAVGHLVQPRAEKHLPGFVVAVRGRPSHADVVVHLRVAGASEANLLGGVDDFAVRPVSKPFGYEIDVLFDRHSRKLGGRGRRYGAVESVRPASAARLQHVYHGAAFGRERRLWIALRAHVSQFVSSV